MPSRGTAQAVGLERRAYIYKILSHVTFIKLCEILLDCEISPMFRSWPYLVNHCRCLLKDAGYSPSHIVYVRAKLESCGTAQI